MVNIKQRFYVSCCPIGCKAKHTEDQIALLINENLEDEDENLQQQQQSDTDTQTNDENSFVEYNISLISSICKNKLKLLQKRINGHQESIFLVINDIDSKNIQETYEFVKGDKIKAIKIKFIQLFHRFKQADLHKFFNMVQGLTNLEILQISNQDDIFQSNPTRMKIPLFQPTRNGSLSKLKHFSLNSTLMQLNYQTLQNFEKALTSQQEVQGCLESFNLFTVECELDKKCFRFINNILYFNRNTLKNIDIKVAECDFDQDNPINEIGKSIQEMKELQSITLQLNLIQSEFELVNTNLLKFFEGISKCKSQHLNQISIILLNVYILSCSKVGQSISRIPSISYFGPISVTQAVEMGIALGKSQQLTNLKIYSKSDEMALMLSYLLHFSKTLQKVHIDYQGKKLLSFKEIYTGLKSNQSLDDITITTSDSIATNIKGLSYIGKGISLNQTLKKIGIMYYSKGDFDYFYKFFDYISSSQSIEQISFDFQSDNKLDKFDPKALSSSLSQVKNLQEFHFGFNPFQQKKKKDKLDYIKLLKGLLDHKYTFNIQLSDSYQDIQEITDSLYIECENLILTQIAFNKIISPFLHYNPIRHIEDLYFS
ncbi:hypothetical protein TTHERM_00283430 (macronuclear) [Tetrahymena thermophila SB210]|uniref:Uncharacterized protein n=1 Tax=Tetrahymena thermophila (strain SB210) TaxID=312017 RepID=I7M8F0_TETTS|nr:hypothetical protein TTHERM_00283430 [Tetrahymena thermophila SB210]EAR97954.2 hypothetical protein TTHERM_00283430 [Tetrahymena thermophila SB210]|eukprot:XP_001018199.2 hypothetical protein TTHERM_00283430 [Tetrahymena thermophila SB210]